MTPFEKFVESTLGAFVPMWLVAMVDAGKEGQFSAARNPSHIINPPKEWFDWNKTRASLIDAFAKAKTLETIVLGLGQEAKAWI